MIVKDYYLYEKRNDVVLTTYVLAEKGKVRQQGKRPAVLICPGGAYLSCADVEAEPAAIKFSAMGYHAFVLRYSTYGEGEDYMPDLPCHLPPKKQCMFPNPIIEIGKAFQIIREHAEEWLVDMEKVAICGFSAGAHNAAMYGCYWNKREITEALNVEAELIRPAAMILCYPVTDYEFMEQIKKEETPFAQSFYNVSNEAYTGEKDLTKKTMEQISPALLVDSSVPPTFLWATSEDCMVPVQNSIRLSNALADNKIPFELHIFEKGNHGLSVADQSSALSKEQINPDVGKWVRLAGAWLLKRFALSLSNDSELEQLYKEFRGDIKC